MAELHLKYNRLARSTHFGNSKTALRPLESLAEDQTGLPRESAVIVRSHHANSNKITTSLEKHRESCKLSKSAFSKHKNPSSYISKIKCSFSNAQKQAGHTSLINRINQTVKGRNSVYRQKILPENKKKTVHFTTTTKQPKSSYQVSSDSQSPQKTKHPTNPECTQCSSIICSIYKKISILRQCFTEKQICSWISCYLGGERATLREIFMRKKEEPASSCRATEEEYEKDAEVVCHRMKQPLPYLQRKVFVSACELRVFHSYLETIFIERNNRRLKDIGENIAENLKFLEKNCESTQGLIQGMQNSRKQPTEVQQFIADLDSLEINYGPMKIINSLNRERLRGIQSAEQEIEALKARIVKRVKNNMSGLVDQGAETKENNSNWLR